MISNYIKKKDCSGCKACINICSYNSIKPEYIDGFFFPFVDYGKCKKCKKCLKVCPVLNRPFFNTVINTYACKNLDENIRAKSSSGGFFSLLAKETLKGGGLVCGAAFDNFLKLNHILVDNLEDLPKLYGSKYLQSDINDTFNKILHSLKDGRQVFFSGTPCQCAGLKAFLQKDYDNLLIADIICHGVPSPKVWDKYLDYLQTEYLSKIEKINFRSKNSGWRDFSFVADFEKGHRYIEPHRTNAYMQVFLNDVCLRESCYDCNFKGKSRFGDITLADFWGVENILPETYDDKGTSLIFVNSLKGQDVFEKIKTKLNYTQADFDRAVVYNSAAVKSVSYNKRRNVFFEKLDKMPFDKLSKKFTSELFSSKVLRVCKYPLRKAKALLRRLKPKIK